MSENVQESRGRRISSPDELRENLHVTSPGLWIILSLIIAALVAMIVAASTIRLENTMGCRIEIGELNEAGEPVKHYFWVELDAGERDKVKTGMTVRFAGIEGQIDMIYEDEEDVGAIVRTEEDSEAIQAGTYDAEIVLEVATPISFLLQK